MQANTEDRIRALSVGGSSYTAVRNTFCLAVQRCSRAPDPIQMSLMSLARCALLQSLQRERKGSMTLARLHGRYFGFQRLQTPPVVELAGLSRCLREADELIVLGLR